jgi:class 3 adenylate cyclase
VTGERVQRRLAAIMAADVAGYSRLMGADEVGTLDALKAHRHEVVDPAIAAHYGRIVKTTGDGVLAEFLSAVDAVTCAMLIQDRMAERNRNLTPVIAFRIGINVGDIIIDGNDIFGDGVNVAARVENECEPGGVCLSGNAFEHIRGKIGVTFERHHRRRQARGNNRRKARTSLRCQTSLPSQYSLSTIWVRLAKTSILLTESLRISSPSYRGTLICLSLRETRPSLIAARQRGLPMLRAILASDTSSKAA